MTSDEESDLVWLEPQTPEQIIQDLLKLGYNRFYVLVSGGKDSMSILHYIRINYPQYFVCAVFTNTGISSQITRKFVLDYCHENNIPLEMTWTTGKTYYECVMEHGFPGVGSHRIIMGYLKFHSWYWFLRDKIKKGEKPVFISGVRKKESMVRNKKRFYTKHPIDDGHGILFCKPFLYKNGTQLLEYFITNGLKKSPAYDYFDKSGECWCGCFYNEWELKMIEKHDPFLFETIKNLERDLQLYGTKEAKKFPYWGRSVGASTAEMQTTFSDFEINEDYCGESCIVE